MINIYFSFIIIFINNTPHIKDGIFYIPTTVNKVITWNSQDSEKKST
jgi:hypothetical protein